MNRLAQTKRGVYQTVTDKILTQIETGTPPWVRPCH